MIEPLRPQDVGAGKANHFPDAVISAFNELILENFVNGTATVKQKDVVERIVAKGIEKEAIHKLGYLNVEEMYRSQGWKVRYKLICAISSDEAYFEFER